MNRIKIALAAVAVLAAVVTVKAGEGVTFESLYKSPALIAGIEVPVPQAVKAAGYPGDSFAGATADCKDSFAKLDANLARINGLEVGAGEKAVLLEMHANTRRSVELACGKNVNRGAAAAKSEFYVRIDCDIRVEGRGNTVSFGVAGLGGPGAELLSLNPGDDDAPIIEGKDNRDIKSMNAQGGDMREDDKTLTLVGDNDGGSFIKLVLFRDSDYKRGWASETGSEAPNWYTSDVSCRVSAL